jgi:hypothetical protein
MTPPDEQGFVQIIWIGIFSREKRGGAVNSGGDRG